MFLLYIMPGSITELGIYTQQGCQTRTRLNVRSCSIGHMLSIIPVYDSYHTWKSETKSWGIKFGGLAVSVETTKLKSDNIIIILTCNANHVMHVVELYAPPAAPLRELYI